MKYNFKLFLEFNLYNFKSVDCEFTLAAVITSLDIGGVFFLRIDRYLLIGLRFITSPQLKVFIVEILFLNQMDCHLE